MTEEGVGGYGERRCVPGYEIKYSMSALFWSPPPPSLLTVPTGAGGWVGGSERGGGEDARGRRREM